MIDGARKLALTANGLSFTAYEMGEGPLVFCVHGFPDTPRTFRLMLPALAKAGYRAVAVTLRGYEPSSQPEDRNYSIPALASDVIGWIDALGGEKAHLIGHDWGANLVYSAATLAPQRVDRIVTIAVPHAAAFAQAIAKDFVQMRRSWYIYFFQMRGWADRAVRKNDFAFLARLWRKWSPGWTPDAGDLQAMRTLFAQPGVVEAALDYYRSAFDRSSPHLVETQRLLSTPITAPTLGICGADDGCISADIFEGSMPPALFSGGVRTVRIARAGHFAHLEQPDAVHEAVLAHLRG